MGRARQIASAENMDRIILDASAASTDEGEFLLLDASAAGTDEGFFVNTEDGTGDAPSVISTAQLEDGAITSDKIAADAVTSAKIPDETITASKLDAKSQSLSRRNIIINGAMDVAQRSTSESSIGATSGYYTCDRWKITTSTGGRLTMSQDSSGPTGFANSIKLDCTTADTSIASDELMILGQSIEGVNLQRFAKGTTGAKAFALSFYAKANASATYVAELYDHDNTRNNTQKFTVGTDFTRHEFIFAADTTGTMDDDNAASLTFQIWLHAGSDYNGGTFASNTWASVTQANRAAGASSFFSSTDNTFFLTGVQLEPVSVSEFEFEEFGETMRKCRRYFQLSESIEGAMNGSNNAFASNGFGGTQAGMRSSGTGALVTGSNKFHQPGVTFHNVTGATIYSSYASFQVGSNIGANAGGQITSGACSMDAEL